MERVQYCYRKWSRWAALLVLPMVALCGCSHGPAAVTSQARPNEQRVFDLKEIAPPQAMGLLSELGLGTAAILPGRNALAVTGSASDLHRASGLLELVDTREELLDAHSAQSPSPRKSAETCTILKCAREPLYLVLACAPAYRRGNSETEGYQAHTNHSLNAGCSRLFAGGWRDMLAWYGCSVGPSDSAGTLRSNDRVGQGPTLQTGVFGGRGRV